jgi:hypothetical protein
MIACTLSAGRRDLAGQHGAGGPGAFLRGIRNSRSLSSNRTAARTADNSDVSGITAAIKMRPRVEIKESGSGRGSVETFPSGAKVVKDDIGRVQEIVSDRGVCVVLGYDEKGPSLLVCSSRSPVEWCTPRAK